MTVDDDDLEEDWLKPKSRPAPKAVGSMLARAPLYSHKYATKKCSNGSINMAKKRAP